MKLNNNIQQTTVRVLFFGGLPVLVGLAGHVSKIGFLAPYLLCLFLELIGLYFLGVVYRTRVLEKIKFAELDKIGNLSSILSCAACNASNIITFIPDNQERVEFECEKCHKSNVVTIQFSVAVMTSPMDNLSSPMINTTGGIV